MLFGTHMLIYSVSGLSRDVFWYVCILDQACSVKMAGVFKHRDEVERKIYSR